MSCLRVSGEKTTQDVTVTSWMTCAQQPFHGLTGEGPGKQGGTEQAAGKVRVVFPCFDGEPSVERRCRSFALAFSFP